MKNMTCFWMAAGFLLLAHVCNGDEPTPAPSAAQTETSTTKNASNAVKASSPSEAKLEAGATEEQIRKLFGEPIGWGRRDDLTTWMYKFGFIKFKNGRVVSFVLGSEDELAARKDDNKQSADMANDTKNASNAVKAPSQSEAQLEVGATEEQIRKLLGNPIGFGRKDGLTTWTYKFGFIGFRNGRVASFVVGSEDELAAREDRNKQPADMANDTKRQQAPGTYLRNAQSRMYAQRKAMADRVFAQRKDAADRLCAQHKSAAEWSYERELARIKEWYDTRSQRTIDYNNRFSDNVPRETSADLALLSREYEIAVEAAKSRYEASLNAAERSWNAYMKEAEAEWKSLMSQ